MALGNILGLIARPNIGDPAGALGRGLQQGTATQANIQRSNLINQQSDQQAQRFKEVTNKNVLTDIANDINTALAMGRGESRTALLQKALSKAPQGSAPSIVLNGILSTVDPAEQEELMEDVTQKAIQGGFLQPTARSKKQKTGSFLVRKPDGTQQIVTGVFDPATGDIKAEGADLPEGTQLISKLGETGTEQTERKVGQKREEKKVTGEETRASSLIERGIAAAETTATIRRSIDLLDTVATGGFDAAALRAKQLFGIESADEGELSNSLGKTVLSQLRETFGAAFTESEGQRLARIEASFGKSPAANKRLLQQTLRIAERTAKRARKAAKERGDIDTVADIDDLLTFTLGVEEGKTEAVEQVQQGVDEAMQTNDPLGIR